MHDSVTVQILDCGTEMQAEERQIRTGKTSLSPPRQASYRLALDGLQDQDRVGAVDEFVRPDDVGVRER
jgi:hypothetical protein